MGWRFFRRIPILSWLRVNVSKRGTSVSLGPPGATVTVGKGGVRGTLGAPGTGFSVSKYLRLGPADKGPRVRQFMTGLEQALATSDRPTIRAALDQQHALGLSDDDLPDKTRFVVKQLRAERTP